MEHVVNSQIVLNVDIHVQLIAPEGFLPLVIVRKLKHFQNIPVVSNTDTQNVTWYPHLDIVSVPI